MGRITMPIRNWRKAFLLVVCACLATFLRAQQPESLLIGPGDTIHIQVFETPDLEQHVRVTDSGSVPLALGGQVKVAGLTPEQAARVIEKTLVQQNIMLHPQVTVLVEEYTTQRVSILGEVKAPGPVTLNTPRSVVEVLSMVGGLTDIASRKILIQRHGTTERTTYFVSNDPRVALDTATMVYPGDTIIVPKAEVVYVLGDVGRPGGYAIVNNEATISVLELVARAGGTTHTAVPSRARLIRKQGDTYVEMPLPLSAMQKGNKADLPLQANDIIWVPFSYLRNFALQSAGVAASVGAAAIYQF